jgi:Fur family ferric uptake transcriptional regulator
MDSQIISSLREKGFKITKVRSGIVEKFINAAIPLSAKDLLSEFHQEGLKINKTTVYRELDFLLSENIIKEIEFGEGQKRYELEDFKHHHHLICLNCRKVEDIELKTDLQKEEARFLKQNDFKVINHSLEFFGYCKDCH